MEKKLSRWVCCVFPYTPRALRPSVVRAGDEGEGGARSREEREEVKLTGWTDRVYLNSPDCLTIHGPPGGKILFSKTNLADTVVWNPWEEKASEMGDLGSGNWGGFVCVEAGQCVTPVSLESGQEWTCGHKLQYCKL